MTEMPENWEVTDSGIRPQKFDDILELKYHKTAASAAFFVLL